MTSSRKIAKDLRAYEGLKKLLVSRRFVPGQRLIFRDLEEMLGMSKTPIVSALVRLERENMVISQHNRGYYVREWSSKDIQQMYELKEKLNGILVQNAVKNTSTEKLADFKGALDEYLAYKPSRYDLKKFTLDMDFHIQLAKMVGNDYLTSVLSQQYGILCYALDHTALTPHMERFEQDHKLLYRAIQQNNTKEAKRILKSHDKLSAKVCVAAIKSRFEYD